MAETLAVAGVAASLVQLTDASIRTCIYLYGFFSALHNSQPEFHRHVTVIRDVHNTIQLIRKTVDSQSLNEAEKEALSSQLNSLTQELSTLEKEIAGKDPTKLRVRIVLALKSAETERALQRLEGHKTTLLLYLQALDFSRSEEILCSQTSTETYLQSLIEQQDRYGRTIQTDIEKGIEDLSEKMGSLDSAVGISQESLEEGFSTISRQIQVSEDHVRNMIRHELQHQLSPLIEETTKRSQVRSTATLRQFRPVDARATPVTAINRIGDREIWIAGRAGWLSLGNQLVKPCLVVVAYLGIMSIVLMK